uniref:T6SS effector BTH_I2691 family protein n=1 Tax=Niveibacterium sp. SC-1 TaxID=3135646 RepID=UPI00405429AA
MQCSTLGHNTHNTHFIVIEQPDKCGTAWIAFSDHKWSTDTLKRYASDSTLRDARMQTIKVWALATTGTHSHGHASTQDALEAIVEYAPGFNADAFPDAAALAQTLSKEEGSYRTDLLRKQSTRYPWHVRTGQAAATIARMAARAKRGDGGTNVPSALALWDAIGITHELNGFRNEAAGHVDQYGRERELQLTAMNAIDGLKVALTERAGDAQQKTQDDMLGATRQSQDLGGIAKSRANAAHLPEPQRSRALQICDIREDWARRNVPTTLGFGVRLGQADLSAEPRRSQEISAVQNDVNAFLARRDKNYHQNIADAKAGAWPKYDEKLDHTALDTFRQKHDSFLAQSDALIDARTSALVNWLEAPLLLDTLEDCHSANISDGVIFEDKVSEALFGLGSTKTGTTKLEVWVREARASARGNLLWRVIALNQTEGVQEVDAALKIAAGSSHPLTAAAWDNVGAQVKWNKLADPYKKAQGLANTNVKSGVTPIPDAKARLVKDVLLTTGDRLFKPFSKSVDTVNEKTLQTLLLIRAGVKPKAAFALVSVQIRAETLERDELLRRLRNNSHYLDEAAKANRAAYKQAWAALRADADVPNAKTGAMNAAKDARLAMVVAILESINLWKVSEKAGKSPKDNKVQAQLLAARLATTSAVMDVASNFVKGLSAAGDRALSYQALKFGGGALSVVATSYGAKLDLDQTLDAADRSDWRFAIFYGERAFFQAVGAGLSTLTALSYCSPLLEALGTQYAERLIGRALIASAARLLAWRAALMLASLEVSIFVLFVSAVIWYFEDDALQKWCKQCAFGEERAKGYNSAEKQEEALTKALKEVI